MIIADVAQETEMIGWLAAESGQKVPVGGLCRIGREPSNDIILNTPAASRHHGLIHKRDDEFWIVDLGGINGIEVNGKRVIQPTRLQPGDRIQLPTVAFTFWQAVIPVPARTIESEKQDTPPVPIAVPEPVPLRQVEQPELMLAVETVPLPARVPKEEPKEPEPTVETELAPAQPIEAKAPTLPPPLSAIKPQEKGGSDRKKSRPTSVPAPLPETRTPAVISTNPQNMSVMAKRSMYIGLASIFLPFLGSVSAVFAIVLGHKALRTIKKSNGALVGRDEAVMGLYFGYITLALILTYSTIIYAFYFSTPSSPAVIAKTPAISTFPPTLEIPKTPPPSPSTAATDSQNKNQPNSSSPATSADTQNIPSPPLPSEIPPSPNIPGSPSPAANPSSETTQIQPLPEPTPSVHDPTVDGYVMKAPVSLREDPSSINTTEKTAPPSESVNLPPSPVATPPVFSPEVQAKLRDGMLAQPMPADSADRSYLDAEAFNNCARILARPPEEKYADSVKNFLDDVKNRNPDPARLQILTAMYANYMTALNNQ